MSDYVVDNHTQTLDESPDLAVTHEPERWIVTNAPAEIRLPLGYLVGATNGLRVFGDHVYIGYPESVRYDIVGLELNPARLVCRKFEQRNSQPGEVPT